jgi:predicted enzyme related to lactoylglutathione lyase
MYDPIKDGIEKTAQSVRYTVVKPPPHLSSVVHSYWELKTEQTLNEDFLLMAFPTDMGVYGAGGALVKSSHGRPGMGGTLVYFSVENCANEEARVALAGGQVLRPKFSIGQFGWVTLCMDTEGNLFGLSSMT